MFQAHITIDESFYLRGAFKSLNPVIFTHVTFTQIYYSAQENV